MATLIEVLQVVQVPLGLGGLAAALWFMPHVLNRIRATVRGLEALVLDVASLCRTVRGLWPIRRRKMRGK